MKLKCNALLLVFIVFNISYSIFSQNGTKSLWEKVSNPNSLLNRNILQNNYPIQSNFYQLDIDELKVTLNDAPKRRTRAALRQSNTIIKFPNADGVMEAFTIMEASTMTPDFQALFPNIRSYAGQGIDNPNATIRFSMSPEKGLSSMV